MTQKNNKTENANTPLRYGYTTGACATAACVAAAKAHIEGQTGTRDVDIMFPDGIQRKLSINSVNLTEKGACAAVVKDAGDDPDITHGALIKVSVREIDEESIDASDFVEICGNTEIVLRAGEGVGRVTQKGLPVPVGKAAINPGPREMLITNLLKTPLADAGGRWLVDIGIKNGRKLAEKTLNPVLGIVGGLSVLGTSGIVVPCSNKAYIDTLRVLLRGAAEVGRDVIYLVTGGRTAKVVERLYPELPSVSVVRIGDFINDAVMIAREAGFERIEVAVMPGKLAKYAQGLTYTHAHKEPLSMPVVASLLASREFDEEVTDACRRSRSMRAFLDGQTDTISDDVLKVLRREALRQFQQWAPEIDFDIIVVSSYGKIWHWEQIK